MKQYKRVLTIAGSDSGGGAGIQADIKTISAMGCYASSVITAITAQNTQGVQSVEGVSPTMVAQQIRAVLDDIGADAVKIGMLHSADIVQAVSETLKHYSMHNIVLDPVMVSTSGHQLIEKSAIQSLVQNLMPIVRMITPNLPEAEILSGKRLTCKDEMTDAAREMAEKYHVSVLLKGGHLTDDALFDVLFDHETNTLYELPSTRVQTRNTHGTGCTLSSAIASGLAQGLNLPDSVQAAQTYIREAIAAGAEYKIGNGFGPVAHFYKYWK